MTSKKQIANNDFEELTSLTALIEPEQKQEVPEARPELDSGKKQETQPLKPNQTTKPQKQTKNQTNTKKKPNSKLKAKKSYATPKEAGETPSKVMTSIIISEDVRDWLRIQSITTKQSMSQQIEELVKKEMKKAKSI